MAAAPRREIDLQIRPGAGDRRQRAEIRDGEVDLAEQKDEDLTHREEHEHRALHEQVADAPDGVTWKVMVQSPGSSNAMILFRHPDGRSSRLDRYNWIISRGPESRSVTSRLDPKKNVLANVEEGVAERCIVGDLSGATDWTSALDQVELPQRVIGVQRRVRELAGVGKHPAGAARARREQLEVAQPRAANRGVVEDRVDGDGGGGGIAGHPARRNVLWRISGAGGPFGDGSGADPPGGSGPGPEYPARED